MIDLIDGGLIAAAALASAVVLLEQANPECLVTYSLMTHEIMVKSNSAEPNVGSTLDAM